MVDWSALLSNYSISDVASALGSLPADVQETIAKSINKPKPSPWSQSAGSVPALLHELDLHTLYGETLAEYEYESVEQLVALGRDGCEDELRSFGVTRDHRDRIAALAFSERPLGTLGGCFDNQFLAEIRPAWASTMGCENMGIFLYALTRFVKPHAVLEVGAGITSLWLLQALRDNHEELQRCEAARANDWQGYRVGAPPPGAEWMVEEELTVRSSRLPLLHCVDNMAHAHTTANKVTAAAERLGLTQYLKLHEADAYDAEQLQIDETDGSGSLDMVWLDFGIGHGAQGGRLDTFLSTWWPKLRPGGYLIVHSTLTNAVTRHWLEKMRSRVVSSNSGSNGGAPAAADATAASTSDAMGSEWRELSFLEPHKRYQNACSVFQKRPEGYGEPILTQYP